MSEQMKAVLESLMPPGAIWKPKPDGDFDRLLAGMGDNAQAIYEFLAALADIRNPRRTPIFEDLEKEYGLIPNLWLGEQIRLNKLLAAKFTVPTTASDDHLQDRLRAAGFDGIVVTSNDPAVDPDLIPGELLVNTPLYQSQIPGYLAQAGGDNTYAGNSKAVAGFYLNIERDPIIYSIPDDWWYWRNIFFVGGAASGWPSSPAIATYNVDWKRENDLKRLILSGKPMHSWAVLVVAFIMFWTHQTAAGGYSSSWQAGAFGGGLHLLVGGGGEIQTSIDAKIWTKRTPAGAFVGQFRAATHGKDLFVIAGSGGEIQTSPDGITWTKRTPDGGFSGNFRAACFDGDQFLLVGDNGEIQTSPDGITWTAQTPDGGYTGDFRGCEFGGGQFVIVGTSAEIQTSPDGITWTAQTPDGGFSQNFYAVAYGDGKWVIAGQGGEIQRSFDGVNWAHQIAAGSYSFGFNTAMYGNGIFVLAGDVGEIQRSFEGKTWKHEDPDGSFTGNFFGSFIGNRLYLIAGSVGEIQTS